MNAADLVAELQARFPCVEGCQRAHAPTSEPYVDVGFEDWSHSAEPSRVDGMPAQLGRIRQLARRRMYQTENEACRDFLRAFNLYEGAWRAENGLAIPVLYWRYAAPHVFWHDDEAWRMVDGARTPVGALKCRLVLSYRPVVEIDDATYDAGRTAQLERDLIHGGHDG